MSKAIELIVRNLTKQLELLTTEFNRANMIFRGGNHNSYRLETIARNRMITYRERKNQIKDILERYVKV